MYSAWTVVITIKFVPKCVKKKQRTEKRKRKRITQTQTDTNNGKDVMRFIAEI